MSAGPGLLTRIRRIFATDQQLADEELARKAAQDGAEQLCECQLRSKVTVRGEVASVTIDKHGGWFEAEVNDGTGSATVVWMGRRTIPGVAVGHTIRVTGRIAARGDEKVIYNPEYELLS